MKHTIDDSLEEQRAELERLAEQDRDELIAEAQAARATLVRIGIAVRTAREAGGVTLDDLALRSRTAVGELREIEAGRRNPTCLELARLAAALDRELDLRFTLAREPACRE